MLQVHVFTLGDMEKVLQLNICEREKVELRAQTGRTPKEVLEESLRGSLYSWYFTDDGVVVGAGGVTKHPEYDGMGIPWVLTDETTLSKHLFTYNSLAFDAMDFCFNKLGMYCLCNMVSMVNRPSVRWLKSLGFEFMEHYKVFEDPNVVFDEFYMYKEDFNV